LKVSAIKSLIAGFSTTASSLLENLSNAGRTRKQAISILIDSGLAIGCLWLAYSLRLDELFTKFALTWPYFVFVGAITPLVFASLGIYRWIIRTSNPRLFRQIVKASGISAMTLLVLMFLLPVTGVGSPRSLFVIFGMLLAASSISIRFLWLQLHDVNSPDSRAEPVAVYGAGKRGQELVNMLPYSTRGEPCHPGITSP